MQKICTLKRPSSRYTIEYLINFETITNYVKIVTKHHIGIELTNTEVKLHAKEFIKKLKDRNNQIRFS